MTYDDFESVPRRARILRWAAPAFAALFLLAAMSSRPPLLHVLAMLAITVVLTLAVDDAFGWLFAWAGPAATVRLDGRMGLKAWAAITAVAAATIALAEPDAALFWGVTAAVAGTSALWLLIGGLLRANAALREARAQLAEMAVAEERLRFARDLHVGQRGSASLPDRDGRATGLAGDDRRSGQRHHRRRHGVRR